MFKYIFMNEPEQTEEPGTPIDYQPPEGDGSCGDCGCF